MLEDLGVSGDVELREYRLEWIVMEDDLLSLELEDVAKDIYLVSIGDSPLSLFPDTEACVDRTAMILPYFTPVWP